MAVEAIAEPWLYATTAQAEGHQVWYCRNDVAWTDVQRNSQNAADQTGRPQMISTDGVKITHIAQPDHGRWTALHARFEVTPDA